MRPFGVLDFACVIIVAILSSVAIPLSYQQGKKDQARVDAL